MKQFQSPLPVGCRHEVVFELFETRLALSAQPLADLAAISQHIDDLQQPLVGSSLPLDTDALQTFLTQAHAASGLNTARQNFGLDGTGQTVAVIDSGIAWNHVALGGGFGEGYRVVGGWDFAENDANPFDDGPMGFHGTHVAGIIGSDSASQPGVAPGVDLVALRVFNDMGQGQMAWVENALQWVYNNRNAFENPITTVNLSLGTTWNSNTIPNWATLEDELRQLYDAGIVVLASAGNSFQQYMTPGVSYPAASPYVIPIASVDDNGQLSDFSQRNSAVIAAPGRNIVSTVPDHVFGRDGRFDDWANASGTSMASPYVAGASVLIREAMEMVGAAEINTASIYNVLRNTADSFFDSATNSTYFRLNVQSALDSILPNDDIGDTWQNAASLSIHDQMQNSSWINTLGDQDVFKFTASQDATIRVALDSNHLSSLNWSLWTNGTEGTIQQGNEFSFEVRAGQTYAIEVGNNTNIGAYTLTWDVTAAAGEPPGTPGSPPATPPTPPPATPVATWESVDFRSETISGVNQVVVEAARSGLMTLVWQADAGASQIGSLQVTDPTGRVLSDSTWENGVLRLDMNVNAGDDLRLQLSGLSSGTLTANNLISVQGSSVSVLGTANSDNIQVNLASGLSLNVNGIAYQWNTGQISDLQIEGFVGNDTIDIVGSAGIEKVEMRPAETTISNQSIAVSVNNVENVSYNSGGGADRIYMYDGQGDDTLIARPNQAEMVGVGYRFAATGMNRLFVHATAGGNDQAFLYDSAGNDELSVRPQFTSIFGDGFFNYVNGFERVYAYATAGGFDSARLYDSAGVDRFTTSGESASITGPGFSSFTRFFDRVEAYSTAGGNDLASIYANDNQASWQQANRFIGVTDGQWSRSAQGFSQVTSFVAGLPRALSDAVPTAVATPESISDPAADMNRSAQGGKEYAYEHSPQYQPSANADFQQLLTAAISAGFANEHGQYFNEPNDFIHGSSNSAFDLTAGQGPDRSLSHSPTIDRAQAMLGETMSLAQWAAERLHLPEESFVDDPELEYNILDRIFAERGQD